MNRLRILMLSLIPVIFSACHTVGPEYTPPTTPLPAQFSEAAGSLAPSSRWWESFDDPLLSGLIDRALSSSPDIKIAEARLRQARALQTIQDAAGGPVLNASGQLSRDQLSKNSPMMANLPPQMDVQTRFTNEQIGFDASWEIDFFGHQQRLSEAAQARSEASHERLQDARLILAAEVARNYIELRMWQQRLRLGRDNLDHYQEIVRLTALAAEVGEHSNLDVQRAAASRDNYAATVSDRHQEMRTRLAALTVLCTASMQELETQLTAIDATTPLMAVPDAPAAGLPSELLQRRPDVRNAERELAAANADIGVAIADLYPRFSLFANPGWNSVKPGSLIEAASSFWSFGARFYWPLYDRGRLQSQVQANEAAFDASLAAYQKTVLSAVADTEIALNRLARSEEKRRQLLTAAKQQRQLVSLTERQMNAGEVAKTQWLDARRNLLNQEDQILQTQAQSLSAIVALYKALGGGWDLRGENIE